jgi:hypothetical protein
MKRALALAIAALLATGCAGQQPHQPVTVSNNPAAEQSAGGKDCVSGFPEVTGAAPRCGIALGQDGGVILGSGPKYPPIIATYLQDESGTTPIPAKKLILFPSSPHGLKIIQACDSEDINAQCWAVRLMDRHRADLVEVNGGKYGPDRWISWSPRERHVALVSRNEGARWLHILDTQTGVTTDYPDAAASENWAINEDSFAWTGENSFTVTILRCETCDVERQSFTLPSR